MRLHITRPPYEQDVSPFSVDVVHLTHSKEGFSLRCERRNIFAILGEESWNKAMELLGHPCCNNRPWSYLFDPIDRLLPIPKDADLSDQEEGDLHYNYGITSFRLLQLPNKLFYRRGRPHELWLIELTEEQAQALFANEQRFNETWSYLYEEDDEEEKGPVIPPTDPEKTDEPLG